MKGGSVEGIQVIEVKLLGVLAAPISNMEEGK